MRHLLLSHIHLDHAGAAGAIVREHPHVQVHVSAIGAPHLVDPSRLEASARRLYGSAFDELWGELAPVPEENIHIVGRRVVGLECFAVARARVAPRVLRARGRHALRGRCGRCQDRAEPARAAADASARHRRRRVVRDARRARAACSEAARARALRRLRRRRAPSERAARAAWASGSRSSRAARRRTSSSSACTQGSASSTTTISRRSSARCRCGSPTRG